MGITLEGIVHLVHEKEQKTDTFAVREMILTVDPSSQYPAYITIQANNDKAVLFDGLQPGQKVTAHLNLNGRLYDDKKSGKQRSFNSLVCWKIDSDSQPASASTPLPASSPNLPPTVDVSSDDGSDDDLPF